MTKVSQFMGGLGIDTRDIITAVANGTVEIGDYSSSTGNLWVGGPSELHSFTANGQAILGNTTSGANRVRIVTYPPNNSVFNQIGDGTFNTGGSYHFARYLSADNIAVTMNTITYSMEVTGNVEIGTNATNTLIVTGNVDVSDNVFVAKTLAVNNTNPAATDALVITGNVRLAGGASQLIFPDGSTQTAGATTAPFPTGDYGLLDTANAAVDAFNFDISGATSFDMATQPVGSLDTEDLGAF